MIHLSRTSRTCITIVTRFGSSDAPRPSPRFFVAAMLLDVGRRRSRATSLLWLACESSGRESACSDAKAVPLPTDIVGELNTGRFVVARGENSRSSYESE
jgi:hypothetical protein